MRTLIKKITVVLLAISLALSMSVCSFAGSKAVDYDYGTYVLLGDSVASGYNDINKNDTEFKRVDYSYGAIVADTIGAEYIPMACPGFRTIEMRFMLEDDFEGDDYLFHDANDAEEMKKRIPEFRKNIAEADVITLGIGGNDFGTFLMWIATDIMEKNGVCEPFVEGVRTLLNNADFKCDIVDSILELADTTDALPELIFVMPIAVVYGIVNYAINWDCMIEDIYALNPDVTLLVIGMFDNGVKTEDDAKKNEESVLNFNIGQMIVDLANTPMRFGALKYGYTFVDTKGTTCDTYHPNNNGHKFIADRILEALPGAVELSEHYEEYDRSNNSGLLKTVIFCVEKILRGNNDVLHTAIDILL